MAYTKEQWDKAKALFEQGLSLNEIVLETNIKDRTSISKKAKKENWEKYKNQQLKADIKEFDLENSTLVEKKSTLVEKVAQLSDFEITTLDEMILSETGNKSTIFNVINLALIRANQKLTKNTRTVLVKTDYYDDKGKKIKTDTEEKEIPLEMTDYKDAVDLADKASLTTGVNQRHSNSQVQVNNTNAIQNNLITLTEDEALKEAERLGVPLSALI